MYDDVDDTLWHFMLPTATHALMQALMTRVYSALVAHECNWPTSNHVQLQSVCVDRTYP